MTQWTDKFSYLNGTWLSPTRSVYLLGRDDLLATKTPHVMVAVVDQGQWSHKSYRFDAMSLCSAVTPTREIILAGYGGEILTGELGTLKPAQHINIDRDEGKVGYLRCARAIAGRVYLAGMDRQVYRRVVDGWEPLDNNLPGDDEEVVGFEAIDGYADNEVYAAGHEGEIWRFDGTRWHQIVSPTNLILLGLHCGSDGYVYVCGQVGTILRGRGDVWEEVVHAGLNEDLWDIVLFKGALYVATRDVLYVLQDGELVPVDFGEAEIPFSFYRFTSSADELITIGAKDVMRFDGTVWSRIDG